MSLFSPVYPRPAGAEEHRSGPTEVEPEHGQIVALQKEVEALREMLAASQAESAKPHAEPGQPSPGLARPRRKPDALPG